MEELDDRFSEEAKMLARLAPKASMEAVRAAWARGLSVTVLESVQDSGLSAGLACGS